MRREFGRYRGTEVDTAGDGFFCGFDGPARAIAGARSIVEGAKTLDLEVRAGVHTGECELVDGKVEGIAVPSAHASPARPFLVKCSSRAL